MSVISMIPETRIVLPSSVAGFDNGRLPDHALRDPGDGRGAMCLIAPYALQAMIIAAVADGVHLGSTGRYRTYARQVALFRERYVTHDTGGPSKTWNGVRYWRRRGVATAATPGASNHGMGCADDVCELDPDGRIIAITDRGLGWLRDNGADFGFALEDHGERWHWHTVFGDVLTVRTMQVLSFCGVAWPTWMGSLPPVEPQPQPHPNRSHNPSRNRSPSRSSSRCRNLWRCRPSTWRTGCTGWSGTRSPSSIRRRCSRSTVAP